jgi:hypothetical protein
VTFHSRLASLEHFSVELIDKKSTPVELIAVALIIDNTEETERKNSNER